MRATATLFACLVFFVGCSKPDDPLQGYKRSSGDLVPFVMDYAVKFGAHPLNTTGLPKIEAEWRYKSDADGVQFYLTGDYFPQVQSFLLAAFGPPAIAAKTNENDNVLGVYAAPTIGAAIQFGREVTRDGTRYTQILIVRKEALNP